MRGSRWIGPYEYLCMRIAAILPRELVYWCIVRAFGRASTGPYSEQIASTITALELIQRWKWTA